MIEKIPSNFEGWERLLVNYYLKETVEGVFGDIYSIEVTCDELVKVCDVDVAYKADVVEKFRMTLRNDRYLKAALTEGHHRTATHDLPNCFLYLVMTLYVDSLLDDNHSIVGAFRSKLASWLDIDYGFQQLQGVARMWRELDAWLKYRNHNGEGFRRLILPDIPKGWTHIGYTKGLSFPNKKDLNVLRWFLKGIDNKIDNPYAIISHFRFYKEGRSLSFGLKSAFNDFSRLYYSGYRALSEHRFWLLLERASNISLEKRELLRIQMSFDEDGIRYYVLNDLEDGGVYLGFGELVKAIKSKKFVGPLSSGYVFFRKEGNSSWVAPAKLSEIKNEVHVAIDSKYMRLVGGSLGVLEENGGWCITKAAQNVKRVDELFSGFGIRSSDDIYKPRIEGGIRVFGGWLGRAIVLPRVDSDAKNLSITRVDGVIDYNVSVESSGKICSKENLDGLYVIVSKSQDSSWRKSVKFIKNAVPYEGMSGAKYKLELSGDWVVNQSEPLNKYSKAELKWEEGAKIVDDVLEAVYADGYKGWNENDFVMLMENINPRIDAWTMMQCLRDSLIVEPRFRNGWRGRVWTLISPQLVMLDAEVDGVFIIEGALCEQQINDFREVVGGLGGQCFRRLGVSCWAPPVIGAYGVQAQSIAERLNWSLVRRRNAPLLKPYSLIATKRHAEQYEIASTWDWDKGHFAKGVSSVNAGVRLMRRQHPSLKDHDVYRVEKGQAIQNYLSRSAAIVAAYAAAAVAMFEVKGNLLVRLTQDGGLPDTLAAELRRRTLRGAGPHMGCYSYPVSDDEVHWLSLLLPGCIEGVTKISAAHTCGEVASISRRTFGKLRPMWKDGGLYINYE